MSIQYKNTEKHYGLVARSLHWSSVILLVAVIYYAGLMEGLRPGVVKTELIYDHAFFGFVFLILMVLRLRWRWVNNNPINSYSIKGWQKRLAINLHRVIYVILFIQVLMGFIIVLGSGDGVVLFRIIELPSLWKINSEWGIFLKNTHGLFLYGIYLLLFFHISAAVYHQIFGVIEEDKGRT